MLENSIIFCSSSAKFFSVVFTHVLVISSLYASSSSGLRMVCMVGFDVSTTFTFVMSVFSSGSYLLKSSKWKSCAV